MTDDRHSRESGNPVVDNIDLWTSALSIKGTAGRGNGRGREAYGIKRLRELILELAFRGRLVPQDLHDAPVSHLLELVAGERARMMKDRILPDLSESETKCNVPQSWQWVRFGMIAQHNSGKTLDRGRNSGRLRNYITTSNLYWGRFDLESIRQMPIEDGELEKCTARKNDLLICEGGEAGRAAVWPYDQEVCFQNHVHRARLFAGINPYYLSRFFEKLNATGEINEHRRGMGISNMSSKALASIAVPLPPLAEQHRIVGKVDELMFLCEQLEQQQADNLDAHQTLVETLLATLTRLASPQELVEAWTRIADRFDTLFTTERSVDRLKQAVLQLAVMGKLVPQDSNDEPAGALLARILVERRAIAGRSVRETVGDGVLAFNIPNSWCWRPLGDLLTLGPTNGFSPKAVDFETPVRSLALSATTSGRFKGEHFKFIATEVPSDSELWLRDGDILVQRGNTIEYVGVSAVYHGEPEQFIYPDLMMKLRVSSALSVDYVHLAMSHELAREYLRARASGTSGSMPKINQATLRSLPIPIPPHEEQVRIVATVQQLMVLSDLLKARIADAQATQSQLADAIVEQAVA